MSSDATARSATLARARRGWGWLAVLGFVLVIAAGAGSGVGAQSLLTWNVGRQADYTPLRSRGTNVAFASREASGRSDGAVEVFGVLARPPGRGHSLPSFCYTPVSG
jgi:hypothetical protein